MRTDREILFDIEKLGYKYEFFGKTIILSGGRGQISLSRYSHTKKLKILISRPYEDTHYLTKDEIKKGKVEVKSAIFIELSLELLKYINELGEYYTKEGFYEN